MEQVTEQDLAFLRQAIELARSAREDGRHPFGALIVNERGETVVAARNNAVRPKGDPTQHAEMVACGEAARLLSEAELARCTLYTSTEPCAMCAGAIYWIGVGRVVFALAETGLLRYTGSHEKIPLSICPAGKCLPAGRSRLLSRGRSWKTRREKCTKVFGRRRDTTSTQCEHRALRALKAHEKHLHEKSAEPQIPPLRSG